MSGALADPSEAPAPSDAELLAIAREIFERMIRFLEQRGYLSPTIDQSPSPAEAWFLRGLAEPSMLTPMRGLGTGLQYGGFGIHAGVTIARGDLLGRGNRTADRIGTASAVSGTFQPAERLALSGAEESQIVPSDERRKRRRA